MNKNRWVPVVIVIALLLLLGICVAGIFGGSALLARLGKDGLNFSFNKEFSGQIPQIGNQGTEKAPSITPAAPGEQVINVLGGDPPTLDPQLSGDSTSATYIVEIFSGLVTYDKDLKLVPDLAKDWEVSKDGLTYTFHLREDATFQDGKPVKAGDFKYSFERACDPQTGSPTAHTYLGDIVGCIDKLNQQAREVSGVKVVDDHTLQISIDSPKVYFISKLSFPAAFVLDQQTVERGGRTWTDQPNGTGPFKLAENRLGELIVLQKNDHYYRDPKPRLDRVNFVLTGGSAMTMYENGDLDMTPVGLNDYQRVTDPNNELNKQLQVAQTLSTFYIGLNTKQPPFDDVKVRQAFVYALNRDKIINTVYQNSVPPAHGIVPPDMPEYKNPNLQYQKYDPKKALELIKESKYGDVTAFPDITLYTTGSGGATGRIIEALVASYKENLGVNIQIQQTDWATYLSDLNKPQNPYQIYGGDIGWVADYPDPENFLSVEFHSKSQQNNSGYSNPQVDKLLDEAAQEQDKDKRMALYQQAEQIIIDEAPWVPLFHQVEYWLVKPYVKGIQIPPMVKPMYQYGYIEK